MRQYQDIVYSVPGRVGCRKGNLVGWYHGSKVSRPQDGEAFFIGTENLSPVKPWHGNQERWYHGSP